MTPESKVKAKVIAAVKKAGAYYCMPVTGGFGNSGVPDILICHKGRFIAVECKAGRGKVTALQQHNIDSIKQAGGVALVINESNVDEIKLLLEVNDESKTN
jgi:hypothetical protein